VFGDSQYGKSAYAPAGQSADTSQFQKSPAFIGSIYDASIASVWQTFTKPLVHTPGDNEWADCHKASNLTCPGEGGGLYDSASDAINYVGRSGLSTNPADCDSYRCGNPLDDLAEVRRDSLRAARPHPRQRENSCGPTVLPRPVWACSVY
jgi:hypothetical protein